MTLFRKLFVTYLLVVILALVISGGFAGYLVFQAAGKTQVQQLRAYGQEFANLLLDKEWTRESLRQLETAADTLDRTQSVRTWLVDREGIIQFASRSALPQSGPRVTPQDMQEMLRGRPAIFGPRPRPDRGLRTFPERSLGPDGNHPGLIVAVPVLRNGEVQGAVLLSPPLDGMRKTRTSISRFIGYGSVTSAIVLAMISFYLSQRISRPVVAVSEAVRRVARGDFSHRVKWDSKDEVGELARAFNEMAADLERLERARKDLIANVSHELKGPLTRISGYLEAINDGIDGPEAGKQHFETVRRETGRLIRLVDDLLDFSRLEAGRLKLHPIPCDPAPALNRAAEVFAGPAKAAGITLEVQIPRVLPIVECEPERVEQALANLLENALAFTPPGGSVAVTARELMGFLQVEVRDTGAGIPADELQRVWERFYKVDRARTPDRGGSGLGLAIVKHLVELQGGQVFATAELGHGSCFGFRLPLAVPEGATE